MPGPRSGGRKAPSKASRWVTLVGSVLMSGTTTRTSGPCVSSPKDVVRRDECVRARAVSNRDLPVEGEASCGIHLSLGQQGAGVIHDQLHARVRGEPIPVTVTVCPGDTTDGVAVKVACAMSYSSSSFEKRSGPDGLADGQV